MTEQHAGGLQAVIFDLDGLILDSETPDYLSWKEVYARHGLDLTVRDWAAVVGRRDIDLYAPLRKRNVDVAAEGESRRRRHASLLKDYLTPAPGVRNLIDQLRLAGVLRGLASNSDGAYVFEIVERLELRDAFDAIITRDDVTRAKPAPDIFLAAVSRLGVEAHRCVALEDSHPGVAAAKAAGLRCIAVPNVFTRHHDLDRADLVVTSLEGVTLEILTGLVSEGTVADPQNPTWRHDSTQR
ncbi:MAG: HAD family hydrolase [bacterium]